MLIVCNINYLSTAWWLYNQWISSVWICDSIEILSARFPIINSSLCNTRSTCYQKLWQQSMFFTSCVLDLWTMQTFRLTLDFTSLVASFGESVMISNYQYFLSILSYNFYSTVLRTVINDQFMCIKNFASDNCKSLITHYLAFLFSCYARCTFQISNLMQWFGVELSFSHFDLFPRGRRHTTMCNEKTRVLRHVWGFPSEPLLRLVIVRVQRVFPWFSSGRGFRW